MTSWVRFALRLPLACAFSMMLAGCGSSRSALDLRVPLPALDSLAREPCPDPGVDRNAEVAIARTRRALADCEDRRGLAVAYSDEIARHFGR